MLLALLGLLGCGQDPGPKPEPSDTSDGEDLDSAPGPRTWYADADADGYGDPEASVEAVEPDAGYVEDGTDCDDRDPGVHPGAGEVCDGLDQDCDEAADEELPVYTACADADADGYGDPSTCATSCGPAGVEDASDCDDLDVTVYPGASEACEDGVDQDCDGADARCRLAGETSYRDADVALWGDGAGDGAGYRLAIGDDMTGDGVEDLLVSMPQRDSWGGTNWDGVVWLIPEVENGGAPLSDGALAAVTGAHPEFPLAEVALELRDLNGDGVADLILGEMSQDAVAVFYGPLDDERSSMSPDQLVSPQDGDWFGWSVGAPADLDGDGTLDLAVGAPGYVQVDGRSYDEIGQVRVYAADDLHGDAWATMRSHQGLAEAHLGTAVCPFDAEGDGVTGLVTSAMADSAQYFPAWADGGVVLYVEQVAPGESVMTDYDGNLDGADAVLLAEEENQHLGFDLACGDDLTGDGYADVAVGSWDGYPDDQGWAYVWAGPLSGPSSAADAGPNIDGVEYLGYAVTTGDFDGDGTSDLAVTAYDAAYLWYGPLTFASADSTDADARFTGPTDSYFGIDVAAGDLDGDGSDDLVFGAPWDDVTGSMSGSAYVFFGGGA